MLTETNHLNHFRSYNLMITTKTININKAVRGSKKLYLKMFCLKIYVNFNAYSQV